MQIVIRAMVRAVAVLALVPVLASACVGNPFAPRSTPNQNTEQMRLEWAQCMRQHGVNVSDPNQSGGVTVQGGQSTSDASGQPPPGGDQQLQAAMNACRRYAPNGGTGSGQPDPRMLDAATKFAQCMREHGIPVQDPQSSGGGVRISASGPDSVDPNSDQFQQAQQACQHYLGQLKPGSRLSTTS